MGVEGYSLLEHDTLSPLYFEAAQVLADPVLLPAVLVAEQRWREDLGEGEEMSRHVTDVVCAFQALAAVQNN